MPIKVLLYPFSSSDDPAGFEKYYSVFEGRSRDGKASFILTPDDTRYRPLAELTPHPNSTIYVFGHCTEGGDYLRSHGAHERGETQVGPGVTINAYQLAGLLQALGLHQNAAIRIKCLNCNSGAHFGDPGSFYQASFATKLKAALIEKGFNNAEVFGYIGSLVVMPSRADQHGVPCRNFAVMNTQEGEKAFPGKFLRISATGDAHIDWQNTLQLQQLIAEHQGDTGIKL